MKKEVYGLSFRGPYFTDIKSDSNKNAIFSHEVWLLTY